MKTKSITAIILVILCLQVMAQENNSKNYRICENNSNGLVSEVFESKKNTEYFRNIVFVKDGIKDTLFIKGTTGTDSCRIKTQQINNSGQEEIIITWYCSNPPVEVIGNATNKIYRTSSVIHEIWDIDTKKKLFSSLSSFKQEIVMSYIGIEFNSIFCGYDYDFSVNNDGKISIKDIVLQVSDADYYCKELKVDHEEGIYYIENGKFVRE
ncbi:MAG: hypothetical protein PHH30_03950 [Bacteroidales bacterium]|nr:hypothetical protein [Bacteroidales bacterium]